MREKMVITAADVGRLDKDPDAEVHPLVHEYIKRGLRPVDAAIRAGATPETIAVEILGRRDIMRGCAPAWADHLRREIAMLNEARSELMKDRRQAEKQRKGIK